MKKKPLIWVLVAILVVVVGALAVAGKQYYQDRYVGTDYYTQVPAGYDMTPQPVKAMNGDQVATGVKYNLDAYSATGETKSVSFTVIDPDSKLSLGAQQPQPGTYLKVTASKTIVLKWSVIDESQVPDPALQLIKQG